MKSCNMLAMQAEGAQITTIEGIAAADGTLHPMQEAFRQNHGLQCGFCTPGMVMSALDLVKNTPRPTEEQIREQLDGNLCRCTGYRPIMAAAQAMYDIDAPPGSAGWRGPGIAADGSRNDVPRTRSNEQRYSPQSKLSRAAASPPSLLRPYALIGPVGSSGR